MGIYVIKMPPIRLGTNVIRLLTLAVLLCCWAETGAAPPPPGWRLENLQGLRRLEIPVSWQRSESDYDPLRATVFSDGVLMIKVARGKTQGPGPKTPKEYRAVYEVGSEFASAGTLTVAGRPAERWRRTRETRRKGRPAGEYIYEEMVFLTDREGFWALWFTSSSLVLRSEPRGLEVWQRFLESFEPL